MADWPRGANRRLAFCEDAILIAAEGNKIGKLLDLQRAEWMLLMSFDCSVRIYIECVWAGEVQMLCQ